ncbi:NAD+ synthase [Helicobacter jaachi]|uniref:NH(3)-dependent NAD(+) synthetase n=1 Tax=Helicobacter jaachi TaxID=1677920 RepID=A0A4U8T9M4_9HELI|nr:NAD+ synthase [Helicobacter jaachi]TLD96344.1 NAD+ synthase [Helicobacter jaachi]
MDTFITQCSAFIRDELASRGFSRVVLGLSGGVDSAVVATLASKALGSQYVRVLLMPSLSSNPTHFDDALNLAQSLNLDSSIIQLGSFQEAFALQEGMDLSGAFMNGLDKAQKLRMGNFCARLRMALLYDCASAENALVLGTSNKSELLLGYGTIFGDLACAINPIGGLYKSEIFALARALFVPQNIINKKPSADLFAYQSDEADLGYSYERIDAFLRAFVAAHGLDSMHLSADTKNALLEQGFDWQMIQSLSARVYKNAFKRAMPTIFDPKTSNPKE